MSRFAVAAWLHDGGHSGADRRLTALLRALPPLLDGDTLVVLHGTRAPLPAQPGVELVPVAIPSAPTWRRALREQRVLPSLLADLRIDLLHLETLPVPRHLPCKCALTLHDLRDLGPFRRRPRWLFARVLARGAARAAGLIVPSEYTGQQLARAVPAAPRALIVPGCLDPAFVTAPHTPSPWPGCFLHVGHLEPRKNLALLLTAYARARPGPPLVLVGRDAGSGDDLRALARRLRIQGEVHFVGAVDDAALRGLYRAARAVLLPSLEEGFGMPALEGLALGRPVFVSDQGALAEIVGPAGTILPTDDADAWAHALRTASAGDARPNHRPDLARFAPAHAATQLLRAWRSFTA